MTPATDALSLLAALSHGFQELPASLSQACALLRAARDFEKLAAGAPERLRAVDQALLRRRVVELAQLLGGGVAPRLCDQLSAAAAAAARSVSADLASIAMHTPLANVDAAVLAVKGCALCALHLGWPHNDAFRVCTAASVVLGAGRQSLDAKLEAVRQSLQRGGEPSAHSLFDLWNSASYQLSATTCIVGQLATPLAHATLAAAVAASVATPQLLLPWLATCSQALMLSFRLDGEKPDLEVAREFADQFCILLQCIGASQAYKQHQQQLAGPDGSALQTALGDVLTQCVWPCLADVLEHDCGGAGGARATAGSSGSRGPAGSASAASGGGGDVRRILSAVTMLGQVFQADPMRMAWQSAAFAPGSLAAGMRAAARMLPALPCTPPPDQPCVIWGLAHATSAIFVGMSAAALLEQPGPRALWLHRWEEEQGDSASLHPGPAAARQLKQLAADAAEGVEAAWVLLRLLPRAAAVLASLRAAPRAVWDDFAYHLGTAVRLLRLLPACGSVAEAADWAAASEAMLRLLPLLGQLDAAGGSEEPGTPSDAGMLAGFILRHLWHDGASNVLEFTDRCSSGVQPDTSNLGALAYLASSVYMTACRAVQAVAAAAAAGDPPGYWRDGAYWALLATGCNNWLTVAFLAGQADEDILSERRYAGLYAAHWEAAGAAIAVTSSLPDCHQSLLRSSFAALAATTPPAAAQLDLAQLHLALQACMQTDTTSAGHKLAVLDNILTLTCKQLRTLTQLAASGLLSEAVQHIALACLNALPDLINHFRAGVTAALMQLGPRAASASARAAEPSETEQEFSFEVEIMVAGLKLDLLCEVLDGELQAAGRDLSAMAAVYQPLLSVAAELAALLLEAWAAPEQQAAQQLALAQAAATRSCAYLRCANLGGEGGPYAGQGVGSMRCSACRAVWYCGTACSHADWRAGHKRVCKALAAARQAEKEAARPQQHA